MWLVVMSRVFSTHQACRVSQFKKDQGGGKGRSVLEWNPEATSFRLCAFGKWSSPPGLGVLNRKMEAVVPRIWRLPPGFARGGGV